MTQDEIIRMAREAGFDNASGIYYGELECFADLVAAKLFTYEQVKAHIQAAVLSEREACAKVCDEHGFYGAAPARDIRARGN